MVGLLAAGMVSTSGADHTSASVAGYTGCLKTGGTGNGTVYALREGSTPLVPCKSSEKTIHLSGGDITAIIAGTGLDGGATSGAATLEIAESYRLPQNCGDGQVAKTQTGLWTCANDVDTNTTYSDGTGLDLTGTTFSIESPYRLPQGCADGQVAKKAASGDWECAADIDTDTDTTYAAGTGLALDGTQFSVSALYQLPQQCGVGQVPKLTAGGLWGCGVDIDTDTNNIYDAGTGIVLRHGTTFELERNQQLPAGGCSPGQVPKWTGQDGWACAADADATAFPPDPSACQNLGAFAMQILVKLDGENRWRCAWVGIFHNDSAFDSVLLQPGQQGTAAGTCTGRVTGGGFTAENGLRVLQSRPGGTGPQQNHWVVEAVNEGQTQARLSAHAVCIHFNTSPVVP